MTEHQRTIRQHDNDNIEAARIIASDPAKYPGAMQDWAQRVLVPSDSEAGPLFAAGKLKFVAEVDHDAPEARVRD